MSLEPGAKIDRFTVQSVLGEGGMGTVYAVTDPTRSGLPLALKVLRDDLAASETALLRFRREAESMQRLRQRGLVWLQEYRLEPPTPWLLMERVPGVPAPGGKRAVTLDDLLKAWGGNLPEPVVASILDICLQGLAAIHNQGLVHRDIKPGNILLDTSVDPYNDPDRALQYLEPKLGDLGLAGLAQPDGVAERSLGGERTMQPELTMRRGRLDAQQAAVLGTYDYMSPEQKRGEKATPASDVYSLTLVAFRLLTGQPMGMQGVRELRPELAPEWDEFLAQGYAPRPEDRYPMATEMRAALLPVEAALGVERREARAEPEMATFVPTSSPSPIRSVRRKARLFVVGAIVIGLAGGGLYYLKLAQRAEAERQQSEARAIQAARERRQAEEDAKAAAAKKAEAERLAAEAKQKAEAERLAAEAKRKAEAERLAAATKSKTDADVQREAEVERQIRLYLGEPPAVDLGGGVRIELVWLAPGSFEMGSKAGERPDRAVHQVTLTKGFWMGKYEVTQEQWEKVMANRNAGGSVPVCASWNSCQTFLQKLNQMSTVKGHGFKVRLPTEAEWEYACRAGTKTLFSAGDTEKDLESVGWYKGNSGHGPHPVGQKQANAWGLYDMHGNVEEWCQDGFMNSYPAGAATDPLAPSWGYRVLRGGSYYHRADGCRSARRSCGDADYASDCSGFRVVVSR